MDARLSDIIAPSFYALHHDIANEKHIHYWLPGGRGSTKSSFVSVELLLSLMRDAIKGEQTHALVMRRYAATLRESIFEQLQWAVSVLKVGHLWKSSVSPMKMTYIPSGQSIMFRGADDATKLKSIKAGSGYIKYLWLEEVNEFEGEEKLRSIQQSVLRGGKEFCCFYSYNPPQAARNWVNRYVQTVSESEIVYRTDYRTVPPEWLGEEFLAAAEHLKAVKPKAYAHEYLGEVTGTGGEVFDNVTLRKLTDEEIARFDKIRQGIDWGYAADPFAYNICHIDSTRRRLYIFREIHKVRLSNRAAAEEIKKMPPSGAIICDSAEPKSIDEMRGYGLLVRGAKKGPDSIEYGIKWLQDLEEIIIDPDRCPETAREFTSYELDHDREGNFKAGFPDHDNHHIDAIRYACENDMRRLGKETENRRQDEKDEDDAFLSFGR